MSTLEKDLDENTAGFDQHRWWLGNGIYPEQHEYVSEDVRAEEGRGMMKQ